MASDLGAVTATSPWIYNQVEANLTGVLVVLLGLGLWRALSPDVIGRIGAAVLIAEGISTFFDGIFHLDCQGIDAACDNVSWHSRAHKIESGFTAALSLLAPLILAFAFRPNPGWRDLWIPSLLTVPGVLAANVAFSAVGDGAATRAGTVVIFAWIAFVSVRLLRKGETRRQRCPETGARLRTTRAAGAERSPADAEPSTPPCHHGAPAAGR